MKSKRILSLIAVLAVSGSVLAGCGQEKAEGEKDTTSAVEDTSKESSNDGIQKISDKMIEVSIFASAGTEPYNDDYAIFKEVAEKTNISLKGVIPKTTTDFEQAFSLMIASGEIADIVKVGTGSFYKYGPEGAFEPLNDLIDEHAPNIKKFLEENPKVKKDITGNDGNIWFVPFLYDGAAAAGWFVRQDWLDKLQLEQPQSVDELYKVLTAFKNEDPNGNGKADEVPFFSRDGARAFDNLYILWNAYPSYFVDENGKVKYGPIEPEYKTAIETLTKWYGEGLIDPEIFTRGGKARDVLLGDNLGGVTHDWFGSTASYNDILKDKIEGFVLEPMSPPANINGEKKEYSSRDEVSPLGWGISSSSEYKVEIIKYFDLWFTEEGRKLANYGIEGDTYTMVDGKPTLTDKVLNGEKPPVDMLREVGSQTDFGFKQDFEYEKQWINKVALKGINNYLDNDFFVVKFPKVKYSEEEQKEVDKINSKIQTYREETIQQWILGSKPVNHEEFVKELKKLGIDTLIEINQTAYDRYMK